MEIMSTLDVGRYVVTPSLRVGHGLERICWPVYIKKDVTDFLIDLSIGLDEEQASQ